MQGRHRVPVDAAPSRSKVDDRACARRDVHGRTCTAPGNPGGHAGSDDPRSTSPCRPRARIARRRRSSGSRGAASDARRCGSSAHPSRRDAPRPCDAMCGRSRGSCTERCRNDWAGAET
jgi:hypothetical protein